MGKEKPSNSRLKALRLDSEYQLGDNLQLVSGTDRNLLVSYLEVRILRTEIYDSSYLLGRPESVILSRLPIVGGLVRGVDKIDRENRKTLKELREEISLEINTNYAEKKQGKPRMIELAINDFVARSTPHGQAKKMSEFEIGKDELKGWAARWVNELKRLE